ncbi:hypothetical protein EDB84DRAFT_1572590 [Lactarius hengduanensis]|nr:hypothetical protein EDB84DRAFT_1572590 [Lactarius hengduanensis]
MVQNRTPSLHPSPPLLPLPSPTPLASKGGRSAPAHSHAHAERELTGVCRPLSAPPYSRHTRIKSAQAFPVSEPPRSRGRGPTMPTADRPLPSPRHPAFARNGDARGHAVPPFPFAQKWCAQGHTACPFPPPSLLSAPPLFTRKGACEGNAPSRGAPFMREGAHEKGRTRPSHPCLPVAQQGRHGAKTGTQEGHAPAPPCLRTQEGGQRTHHVPWRGRRQPSPPPPTHARGEMARPPSPLRAGNASPATRTPHHTTRARKGRRRRPTPPHGPFRPRVYAPRHTRGHRRVGAPSPAASAQGAPPGLRPGGGACEGAARKHARTRRVTE